MSKAKSLAQPVVLIILAIASSTLILGTPQTATADVSDLVVIVKTDKMFYDKGEPVNISVELANQGLSAVTLHFGSGCQGAFVIRDDMQVQYDLRLHIGCPLVLTELTLQPSQATVYSFVWGQVDNSGNQVPVPARYTVEGIILSQEPVRPGLATIQIERRNFILAAFTWQPCVACLAPGNVVFFDAHWSAAFPGSIVQYTWDFGDGSPPVKTTDPLTTHIFLSSSRTSLVTLSVLDSRGLANTVAHLVSFTLVPRLDYRPPRPMVGQSVVFNASGTISYAGKILGLEWDFGDGSKGSGDIIRHAYSMPGIYRVILTVLTEDANPSLLNPSLSKTVIVRLKGDVNNDCSVNIFDVGMIAFVYNSSEGDSRYNYEADLDYDGHVIIVDVAISASEFGHTCP